MSAEAQQITLVLLSGNVPSTWQKDWTGAPTDPVEFLTQTVRKADSVQKWLERLRKSEISTREPVNLGCLLRPATFLNALRQKTARYLKVAMDTLELQTIGWAKDHDNQGLQVQLTNLKLEGAKLDINSLNLVESKIESSNLQNIPDLIIGWGMKTERRKDSNKVELPLYLDASREVRFCLFNTFHSVNDRKFEP